MDHHGERLEEKVDDVAVANIKNNQVRSYCIDNLALADPELVNSAYSP